MQESRISYLYSQTAKGQITLDELLELLDYTAWSG